MSLNRPRYVGCVSETALLIDCPPVNYWKSNPYALAFSPDGTKLAVGSGCLYGHGGLSLVDIATGTDSTIRFVTDQSHQGPHASGFADMPVAEFDGGSRSLTVSGVAFDGSGDYVAACAWGRSKSRGSAFLFRTAGHSLDHQFTFDDNDRGAPTGVAFMDGRLHFRNMARRLEDVFFSYDLPSDVDTETALAHRSHARVARVQQQLVTGGGGSLALRTWTPADGWQESNKATTGLVVGFRRAVSHRPVHA